MKRISYIGFSLSLLFSLSCNGENVTMPDSDGSDIKNNTVALIENVEIAIGERLVLTPKIGDDVCELTYLWSSNNTNVAVLSQENDYSLRIIGMQQGTTVLSFRSADNRVAANCTLTVVPRTIKVLAIGNSFSADAVENYLYDLAKAEGITLVIGNVFIGGCSLEKHWNNVLADASAYSYRKIDSNGERMENSNWSIKRALADESWDYVSLQQASPLSGIYATYEAHLPQLVRYVRQNTKGSTTLMLHQTWAYAKNSTHSGFTSYGKDQSTMYNAIIDATVRAAQLTQMDIIVPSGTAIQNGRTSILGDSFNRDGHHLETTYGRYTAACTWFEKLFNRSVVGNDFAPKSVTEYNKKIAQHAAHYAVGIPNAVTEMVEFQKEEEVVETENTQLLKAPIYIDFGSVISTDPWNNIASIASSRVALSDGNKNSTGVFIRVSDPFGASEALGELVTTTGLNMPEAVSKDYFMGNTGTPYNSMQDEKGELLVTCLNKNQAYIFTFFSSRTNSSVIRETQFTVSGATSEILLLNAAKNKSQTVSTQRISADAQGRILISVTSGPNSSNGQFHINAMSIVPVQ